MAGGKAGFGDAPCEGFERVRPGPEMYAGEARGRIGTRVIFTSAPDIIASTEFDYKLLQTKLSKLADAISDARFILEDFRETPAKRDEMLYERAECRRRERERGSHGGRQSVL